jgi:hypothetical protein
MRWTRQRRALNRSQGRLVACERSGACETNGAEADGKTVWSWHPLLVSSRRRSCEPDRVRQNRQSADDGDKTNSSPGRARHKPLKPFACGNAGFLRWTCGDYARVLFHFAREAAGALGTRHSPRPPQFGAEDSCTTRARLRRGMAKPRARRLQNGHEPPCDSGFCRCLGARISGCPDKRPHREPIAQRNCQRTTRE